MYVGLHTSKTRPARHLDSPERDAQYLLALAFDRRYLILLAAASCKTEKAQAQQSQRARLRDLSGSETEIVEYCIVAVTVESDTLDAISGDAVEVTAAARVVHGAGFDDVVVDVERGECPRAVVGATEDAKGRRGSIENHFKCIA